jgi:hydrogenase maturation factor
MIAPEAGAPRCDREHGCITCSDEGVPLRVLRVSDEPGLAICAGDDGEPVDVMTGIVGDVKAGDILLVHAGTALMRLANTEKATGEVRR